MITDSVYSSLTPNVLPRIIPVCSARSTLLGTVSQFVIFKPLSSCFEETIGFDIKASFASRPVSLLISWYNNQMILQKNFDKRLFSSIGTFHGLKITNWSLFRLGNAVIQSRAFRVGHASYPKWGIAIRSAITPNISTIRGPAWYKILLRLNTHSSAPWTKNFWPQHVASIWITTRSIGDPISIRHTKTK